MFSTSATNLSSTKIQRLFNIEPDTPASARTAKPIFLKILYTVHHYYNVSLSFLDKIQNFYDLESEIDRKNSDYWSDSPACLYFLQDFYLKFILRTHSRIVLAGNIVDHSSHEYQKLHSEINFVHSLVAIQHKSLLNIISSPAETFVLFVPVQH